MMTDPIADMLTRIRNAQMARLKAVEMPNSKIKKGIADILCAEKYLESVEVTDGTPAKLVLVLKYSNGQPAITSLKRESKPGHRMYRKAEELKSVLNGYGMAIVSTPQGLMNNKTAKKKGMGGEIICSVY